MIVVSEARTSLTRFGKLFSYRFTSSRWGSQVINLDIQFTETTDSARECVPSWGEEEAMCIDLTRQGNLQNGSCRSNKVECSLECHFCWRLNV